jgi:hypothetical protein
VTAPAPIFSLRPGLGPGKVAPGRRIRNQPMNTEQQGNGVVQEVLIFLAIVATIFALA